MAAAELQCKLCGLWAAFSREFASPCNFLASKIGKLHRELYVNCAWLAIKHSTARVLTRFAKLRKTSCDSTWYTVSRNVTRYCRKNCVSYRWTVIRSTSSLISSAYYHGKKEDKGRSLSVCSINGNFLIISAPSVGVRSDGSRFTYVHTQASISFFCYFGSQTTTPVHYWMPIVIVPDLSIDSRASAILAHSTRYHILPVIAQLQRPCWSSHV